VPGGEGGAFSRWADGISPQASPFDSKPPEESGEFQSDGVGWYLGSTWAKREGGGDPASYGYPTLGQVQKVAYVEPGRYGDFPWPGMKSSHRMLLLTLHLRLGVRAAVFQGLVRSARGPQVLAAPSQDSTMHNLASTSPGIASPTLRPT
jgi:hypothetical protein